MFFRRLLCKRWFGWLRVQRIRNAQGAGDRFVVARFAGEVQIARRKRHENDALVVVVDGDRLKMQRRLRELDKQLAAEGLAQRGRDENVLIVVPTRNVETWELWLCGQRDLDEDQDYKVRCRMAVQHGEVSVREAVEAWFQASSREEERVERESLPSLTAGRLEVKRLDQLGN